MEEKRGCVRAVVESRKFQTFIICVIFLNAVVIGLHTVFSTGPIGTLLWVVDALCLVIYVLEAGAKIYAWRGDYFKDGWNVFDFTITALSLIPDFLLPVPMQVVRVIRIMRIVRIFRFVSAFRQLRIIVEAIGKSIPGVAWTALLLLIIMYMFDVIGVSVFSTRFPQYFGDLGIGAFTLFQVVTLEGWPDLARDIMGAYPLAWLYFVPFVVISAFIILNVVLGIILGTIQDSTQRERINMSDAPDAQLHTELEELKKQIETVEYLLEKHEQRRK